MQTSLPIFNTSEVFVAGKQPTITYNPRDNRHLEREVRTYVDQPGKALSVSGPTKSGKTVLIDRLLPPDRAVWLQGSDLDTITAFWRGIVDSLNAFDQVAETLDEGSSRGNDMGAQVGLPHAINFTWSRSRGTSLSTSRSGSRSRPLPDVAREALRETPYPVVVDDFHYVEADVKRALARAVKTLIGTTHVILIAVPHEAFEAVRAEPDMDARIWQLRISHWSIAELEYIAREGFRALNILDPRETVGRELARASYGAPFLMQQLCYDYALSLGVVATASDPITAAPPPNWDDFYRRIADRSVPGVFDRLARGPNPRGQQRIDRVLNDGRNTDIYGAILFAISKAGTRTTIRPSELTRILENELRRNPPTRQQIVASLGHMKDIAREARGTGDPALDYKNEESCSIRSSRSISGTARGSYPRPGMVLRRAHNLSPRRPRRFEACLPRHTGLGKALRKRCSFKHLPTRPTRP